VVVDKGRKIDQMGFWVSFLLLVGSLQCSVCYEVTIFKTDPSTTSASVDSYYYGLPKKDLRLLVLKLVVCVRDHQNRLCGLYVASLTHF
jgi:hypothetical protein